MVKLFVHSTLQDLDPNTLSPVTASTNLDSGVFAEQRGLSLDRRSLAGEDLRTIKYATDLEDYFGEQIEIHDLSKPEGWVEALRHNVHSTPSLVASDQKYEGFSEICHLLDPGSD